MSIAVNWGKWVAVAGAAVIVALVAVGAWVCQPPPKDPARDALERQIEAQAATIKRLEADAAKAHADAETARQEATTAAGELAQARAEREVVYVEREKRRARRAATPDADLGREYLDSLRTAPRKE